MGSLTIDTGFNLSGAEKGYKRLNQLTNNMARETAKSFGNATAAITKQQLVVDELKNKLKSLSSGELQPKELTGLEISLKRAQNETEKLSAQFEKLASEKDLIESKAIIFEGKPFLSDEDLARIDEIQLKLDGIAPRWEKAEQSASEYNIKIEQIKNNPLGTAEAQLLSNNLVVANKKLSEMQVKAKQIASTMPPALGAAGAAAVGFGTSITKTIGRIKSLLVSVLVFNVLRKAFKGLRDYIGVALKDNQAFANSWAQVKANISTLAQPFLQFIIPVIVNLTKWLALATQYLLQFVSALTGKSIKSMQNAAKNMNALAASTKKASKEADKFTASFDEIQQVSSNTSDISDAVDTGISPQYSEFDELTDKMKETMIKIATIVGGAFLVLGAILTFTGANIPLGIALMAVGAAVLVSAIATNWDSMSDSVKSTIGSIAMIVSGALLVLGAIFAFSGANIPLGIAFMLLGAVGLASAISLSWNSMSDDIKNTIITITTLVSISLLALGAIFAFTGANIPLGIGMMLVGAVGLATSIAQSSALTDETRRTISTIMGIVGGALIALGVILLCFGVIPIGLALLVAGAVSLVTAFFVNKDEIINWIKGVLDKIGKLFSSMWEGVKYGASLVWWGIKVGVLSMVNYVIDAINALVKGILTPFNLIIDGLNLLPGVKINKISWSIEKIPLPPLPALATGTVVPPNRQFAAILGDNKNEPEIVSPVSTIEQAVENVISRRGVSGGGEITIVVQDKSESGMARFLTFTVLNEMKKLSPTGDINQMQGARQY